MKKKSKGDKNCDMRKVVVTIRVIQRVRILYKTPIVKCDTKVGPGDTVSSTQLIQAVRHVEGCGPGGVSQFSPTHYSSPHHLFSLSLSENFDQTLSLSLLSRRAPTGHSSLHLSQTKATKFCFFWIFSLLISYTQFLSPTQIETLKPIPFLNIQTKMVVFSQLRSQLIVGGGGGGRRMSVTELKERHAAATETVNTLRERLRQRRRSLLDTDGVPKFLCSFFFF